MTKNDFEMVRTIWKKTGIEITTSDNDQELSRMITRNPHYCFVLEIDKLIGAVLGGFDGRRGWIHHLAVLPDFQNRGYGKLLLNEVISAFEKDNIVKIKLEVVDTNKKIIEFYNHLGWDLRPELTTMSMNLPRQKK